jgi:hypothetical protein
MWEFFAAIVSALVAFAGLLFAWRNAREAALRKGEVLAWSNDVIGNLQSLVLICQQRSALPQPIEAEKLRDIYFATSVLAEQGRLFFKNERAGNHGVEKQEAFRGLRADILDQVILAHQIAGRFERADEDSRLRMACVAEDAERRFVTLAQKEVGRVRTASVDTSKGGYGAQLNWLMDRLDQKRLDSLRRQFATRQA